MRLLSGTFPEEEVPCASCRVPDEGVRAGGRHTSVGSQHNGRGVGCDSRYLRHLRSSRSRLTTVRSRALPRPRPGHSRFRKVPMVRSHGLSEEVIRRDGSSPTRFTPAISRGGIGDLRCTRERGTESVLFSRGQCEGIASDPRRTCEVSPASIVGLRRRIRGRSSPQFEGILSTRVESSLATERIDSGSFESLLGRAANPVERVRDHTSMGRFRGSCRHADSARDSGLTREAARRRVSVISHESLERPLRVTATWLASRWQVKQADRQRSRVHHRTRALDPRVAWRD